MIKLENITKKFGSNTALENVTFHVAPGTVFALLGENGAGKTTAIKIMLGFLDPDQGRSTVLGLDSKRDNLLIRQKVGYVPEQPTLYDWMKVEEIGRFMSAFYNEEYWIEFKRLVQHHDLPFATPIKSLSKGMRAKVSLCLALSHDPELLILDEPTSGLDALVRREFLESMVERAATGKTVFLSSHQIGEVERVADTIGILKKSKLVLVEPLEQLKSTTRVLRGTLKSEMCTDFAKPFQTVVQETVEGRQVKILGRNLDANAEVILQNDSNYTQFEFEQPSLEEIFVAYMAG